MGAGGIINDGILVDFPCKLTFSPDHLNKILAGLNELPRKHSEPVFQEINMQVRAQYESIQCERKAQTGRGERPAGESVPVVPGQSGVSDPGVGVLSRPQEGGEDTRGSG